MSKAPNTWKKVSKRARKKCEQIVRDLLKRTNHPAKLEVISDQEILTKPPRTFDEWLAADTEWGDNDLCATIRKSATCTDTIFLLWVDGPYTMGTQLFHYRLVKRATNLSIEWECAFGQRDIQYMMFYNGRECGGFSADFESQVRNFLNLPARGGPMECVVCFEPFNSTFGVFTCGHTVSCPACTLKMASCAVCRTTKRNKQSNYAMSLPTVCEVEDRRYNARVQAMFQFMEIYVWKPFLTEKFPGTTQAIAFFSQRNLLLKQIQIFIRLKHHFSDCLNFEFLNQRDILLLPFLGMRSDPMTAFAFLALLFHQVTDPTYKLAELTAQIYNASSASIGCRKTSAEGHGQAEVSTKETKRWWGFV